MQLDPKLFRNVQTIGDKTVAELNVQKAKISKWNIRGENSEDLESLKESIKSRGVIQPVKCTSDGEVYVGQRRLKACKELGIEWIPCIIEDLDPVQQLTESFQENKERKEHDWISEAKKFKEIINAQGISINELEKRLGVGKDYVGQRIRSYERLEKLGLLNDSDRVGTISFQVVRIIITSDIPDYGVRRLWCEIQEQMAGRGQVDKKEIQRILRITNSIKYAIEQEKDAQVRKQLILEFGKLFYTKDLDYEVFMLRVCELTNANIGLKKIRICWEDMGIKSEEEAREWFKKNKGVWERNLHYSEGFIDKFTWEKGKHQADLDAVKTKGQMTIEEFTNDEWAKTIFEPAEDTKFGQNKQTSEK